MRLKGIILIILIGCFCHSNAQFFISNNGVVSIKDNALVVLNSTNLINNGYLNHAGFLMIDGSLTNNDSVICTSNGNNVIQLNTDWTNNDYFESGDGLVELNGANQSINGTKSSSFYKLYALGNVGEVKTVNVNIAIEDTLNITDIELAATTNVITLEKAEIQIVRNSGYLSTDFNGVISENFKTDFVGNAIVPMGYSTSANDFKPFTLHSPAIGNYEFSLYGNAPSINGQDELSLEDSLCKIQDFYYYKVKTSNAALDFSLTLHTDEDEFTKLGRWDGTEWDKVTASNRVYNIPNTMNYNQPAGVSNYLSLAKERPYAYAGEDIVMVSGMNTAQIDGSGLKPATATMYWDPIENLSCSDCFDPIFYYDSPYGTQGKFVLTIDNGPGCISTDTMEIVYWRKKVFIQNAFTPNEDDINNVFTPVLLENEEMLELVVFNRWGELVYQGIEGWDGTFSGKPAPQGVYVYRMIINQILLDGFVPRAIKQGDLTLLR